MINQLAASRVVSGADKSGRFGDWYISMQLGQKAIEQSLPKQNKRRSELV